jgi:hypothetical protein
LHNTTTPHYHDSQHIKESEAISYQQVGDCFGANSAPRNDTYVCFLSNEWRERHTEQVAMTGIGLTRFQNV